jgi:hypothetical protein
MSREQRGAGGDRACMPRCYPRAAMGGAQTVQGPRTPRVAPAWSAGRLGIRIRLPGRASGLASAIDIGCVLVVVIAVLLVGIVEGLGLSPRVELLGDLAAAVLLVLVVSSLVRGGAVITLPFLALAYMAVVAIAALRADGPLGVAVSGHNFLFYQALALGLAALGPRERRNRAVLLTVVALMVVEFAITIIQAPIVPTVDQVVGTFGNYATSTLLFAIVTAACLAVGVYAAGTGGGWWLALGAVLPLCSIWGATRISLLVVPAAGGAICVAAWWILRGERARQHLRRPLIIASVFLAVPAVILASYAAFDPSYLQLAHVRARLFGSTEPHTSANPKASARNPAGLISLPSPTANGIAKPSQELRPNKAIATYRVTPGPIRYRINPGARLARLKGGGGVGNGYVRVKTPGKRLYEGVDYTTPRIKAGASYRISAYVRGIRGRALQVIVGDAIFGVGTENIRTTAHWRRYSFSYSPQRTGKTGVALRKLTRAKSKFFVDAVRVGEHGARLGSPPPKLPRALPSVQEQYQAAERLIDGSPTSFLLGQGLGTSTFATNLGVKPTQRDARWTAYSDFGTLLVELGWLGVVVSAACALGLALGSIAAARRAPPGSWTRALLIAYPGVLVATAAATLYGNPFRGVGPATIFWVLTGLVLASILEQRDRSGAVNVPKEKARVQR